MSSMLKEINTLLDIDALGWNIIINVSSSSTTGQDY